MRPIVLEVTPRPGAAARERDARGPIGIDELERARARMIELSATLAQGETAHFEVTDDASACTYCAYATACASKPPPVPQRFGH